MIVKCAWCGKTGKDDGGGARPCRVCKGAGSLNIPDTHVKCARCGGTGAHTGSRTDGPCRTCKGVGHVAPHKPS